MWKSFSQNEHDPPIYLKVEIIYVKTEENEEHKDWPRYKVSVTNYIKMWCGEFDTKRILKLMLDSNKGLEADDKGLLDTGLHMLQNPKQVDKKEFLETQSGHLSVWLLRKGPIVLKLNFSLTLSSAEEFFHAVTKPMLEIIHDQTTSENKLRQHLLKKDQEIKGFLDMLPEKSPLMRCLRTQVFNDEEHMRVHCTIKNVFGTYPDEINPRNIIQYGRPLPAMPLAQTMKTDKSCPGTSSVAEKDASIQIVAIKTEPAGNLTCSKPDTFIPADKMKPDDTSSPNKDKVEPNNNSSTRDKSNIDQMQIVKVKTEAFQTTNDPDVKISPVITKPEVTNGEQTLECTPKKRRKKLNY